jgi:hypothetical protein
MGTGMQMTHTSQGNLSMGFGFPNGPVPGLGGVTATGSAPATLRVPQQRFQGPFSTKLPIGGGTLIQITTMLSADGPAAPATLAAGGGPGSFTWCPGDPACVAGGGMLSTDPPQGAGARNGRIVYRAGANQFGGVMQMVLAGSARVSRVFQASPFQVIHFGFSALAGSPVQHTGGPYSFMQTAPLPANIVTQPLAPPAPGGLITAPGPVVSAIPCDPGTGAPFPCTVFHTGFPFTTGTVFVQQTTGSAGDDFFSVMGSDQRTALGAGNLSLVAGGLSRRANPSGSSAQGWASFGRVQMTLAPPIPTLSPAGLAAAVALLLLAVGYAARGR